MRPQRAPVSLRDPDQASRHLVSMMSAAASTRPSLLLIAGDSMASPTYHVEIVDCATDPDPSECAVVLSNVLDVLLADAPVPVAGAVLGLLRPGGDRILPFDRAWFRALHRTCHTCGLLSWGVFVVGAQGVRMVTMDDAA